MEPARDTKTKRRRSSTTRGVGPAAPSKAPKVAPSTSASSARPKRNLRQEKLAKKKGKQASEEPSPNGKKAARAPRASNGGKSSADVKGKGKAVAGVKASPQKQAEYHSSSDEEEEEEDTSAAEAEAEAARVEKKKFGARRRKKGKVFMEDKSSLLHLLDGVTASKDAVISAKLGKERDRAAAATALVAKREAGKKGRKADERAKAMDAAKAAILVREREKKDKRKQKKGAVVAVAAPSAKKRVGFA